MSLRFAVVYEAPADLSIVTEIADNVISSSVDWVEPDAIQHYREWIGQSPCGRDLKWTGMKSLSAEYNIKAHHGHFNGDEPALPDATAARRAILVLQEIFKHLDAIVLMRDQDDTPERFDGIKQARCEHLGSNTGRNGENELPRVVVGFARCERESWVLCGFNPCDEDERGRVNTMRQELGFNPCTESHRLTATKRDHEKLSPKRVLQHLTGGSRERERECWIGTPIETLRERGTENGLTDFLNEVESTLVPLFKK